jgi:xylitol oxidase
MRNWAQNVQYSGVVLEPESEAELLTLVAESSSVRALGSRHSFNRIADCAGTLLSMRKLNKILEYDDRSGTVIVEGGITYAELCRFLQSRGRALPNLASLPHISIAGAIATGTHGSGDKLQNLGAPIRGIEFVRANAEKNWVARGDDIFDAHVVHLGKLGLISKLEIETIPAYEMQQHVYVSLRYETALNKFDSITSSATSVSMFTRWGPSEIEQVWLKNRDLTPPREDFFGATLAKVKLHPLSGFDPTPCTEQGFIGPWHERLPHFRPELEPSGAGAELQSEYIIPRASAREAIQAMLAIGQELEPLLLTSEIRTMAGDTFWMSPAFGSDRVGIHFTWKPVEDAVRKILPKLESSLLPLGARPHWGKIYSEENIQFEALYPRWADFCDLSRELDPKGKFRNP